MIRIAELSDKGGEKIRQRPGAFVVGPPSSTFPPPYFTRATSAGRWHPEQRISQFPSTSVPHDVRRTACHPPTSALWRFQSNEAPHGSPWPWPSCRHSQRPPDRAQAWRIISSENMLQAYTPADRGHTGGDLLPPADFPRTFSRTFNAMKSEAPVPRGDGPRGACLACYSAQRADDA